MLVERPGYVDRIIPYLGMPLVKVLTGIRRCGKSQVLALLKRHLLSIGVPADHVIDLNFEVLAFGELTTAKALNAYLEQKFTDENRYYLLLDEIQEVSDWEKVVNSLQASRNVDIVITGSNSRLLSSELSTYLAGRYISFQIMPLSFREHLDFAEAFTGTRPTDLSREFSTYLRRGGFPVTRLAALTDEQVDETVRDIYTSVLLRDTLLRKQIRNVEMLERIVRFVFENVGNPFSAKSISDYFKSQQRKVDPETVYSYLNALEESFLVNSVPRYDIAGKELLKTFEKLYIGDHSLISAVLGYSDRHIPGMLENIVWQELLRRGWTVRIGKIKDMEVDFIAERGEDREYFQVTMRLANDEAVERELAPLRAIADSYPKTLLTLDAAAGSNHDGIRIRSLPEWLLAS
jgi:predicted AAA+ superfamily ATPase